jgi:CubicO group peptidase (beta-lactamase class C family)
MRILALVAILILSPIALGQAKKDPTKSDPELLKLLKAALAKHDVPGMGAAVVTPEGLAAVAVAGVRERGKTEPITLTDRFHIGSCTKMMTAFLLAGLIEQKKLEWKTPLDKLIPSEANNMSDKQKKIQLYQLTSHTAGFPSNPEKGWWSLNRNNTQGIQRTNAVAAMLKETAVGEPGEKFNYSNISYVLAGIAAQNAANKDWESLMQERIFKPLKMETAGFGIPGSTTGPADQPRGHDAKGVCMPKIDNPPLMGPAGTIHVSMVDWAKFGRDYLRGVLGEKAILKQASYRTLLSAPPENKSYAIGGWTVSDTSFAHNGSNTLNYCTIVMMPRQRVVLLVACNQSGPGQKAVEEVVGELTKRVKK